MIKSLFFAITVFLVFSTSSFAAKYLITTKDRDVIKNIESRYKTIFKKSRINVVDVSGTVEPAFEQYLKLISQDDVQVISTFPDVDDKPNQDILRVLNNVSIERMEKDMGHLVGYKTRRAGTDINQESANWLGSQFKSIGIATEQHCYKSNQCNIIGKINGRGDGIIVVVGHFDSVGRDFAGADDNGSGTAALLEMARVMKDLPLTRSVYFLAANGEEQGLLGSTAYVRRLEETGEITRVQKVINMDMISYNVTDVLNIETDRKYVERAKQVARIAKTYTHLEPVITSPAWGSDHVPFLRKNIYSFLTIEDWDNANPCYHKSCDTLATVSYDYMSSIVKINIATILEEAL